jgi:excisionase family DNA binding protein
MKDASEHAPTTPLLTIKEVVTYTRVSEKTIRRATRDGRLRSFRLPGGLRFRLNDVDGWIDSFLVEPDPAQQTSKRRTLSDMLSAKPVR